MYANITANSLRLRRICFFNVFVLSWLIAILLLVEFVLDVLPPVGGNAIATLLYYHRCRRGMKEAGFPSSPSLVLFSLHVLFVSCSTSYSVIWVIPICFCLLPFSVFSLYHIFSRCSWVGRGGDVIYYR